MMNPMDLLKLRPHLHNFKENHPKLLQFVKAAAQACDEGSIIEVTMTTSDGRTLRTNMKISAEDLELMKELKNLK